MKIMIKSTVRLLTCLYHEMKWDLSCHAEFACHSRPLCVMIAQPRKVGHVNIDNAIMIFRPRNTVSSSLFAEDPLVGSWCRGKDHFGPFRMIFFFSLLLPFYFGRASFSFLFLTHGCVSTSTYTCRQGLMCWQLGPGSLSNLQTDCGSSRCCPWWSENSVLKYYFQ